jgi:hypothetical protein
LAKGFIKQAGKSIDKAKDILVKEGRAAAKEFICAELEVRTGLPSADCKAIGEEVTKFITKDIRNLLKR